MSDMVSPIKGPFDKLPPREPGTIVVAVGPKGAVSLQDGTRLTWGERVLGGYRTFYLVDISTKTIKETYSVPSSQQAFSFKTMVSWDVAVADPRLVIEKGITNLRALLDTPGRNAIVTAARSLSVEDVGQAERTVRSALLALSVDPAIRIVGVAVEMRPDDMALELLRTVQEQRMRVSAIEARTTVDAAARQGAKAALASLDELLAHSLVTKDEGYRAEYQRRLAQASTEYERRVEVLRALIDNKIIEPQDFHERFPDFLNEVFKAVPPSISGTAHRLASPAVEEDAVKRSGTVG